MTEPEIRPYRPEDLDGVLGLLHEAMAWELDERHRALFAWKHHEGPLGPSPAWVAVDTETDRIVGLRTFVRWPLELGEVPLKAVRAVDTAVHPTWQRRRLFTHLTELSIDVLTSAGTDLVFNTPNRKSAPGYQKMGWELLGRLPVRARMRSLSAAARVARSRQAASRWSVPSTVGCAAAEVLADSAPVADLLRAQPPSRGVRTRRSPELLAWRYGFPPLHYRALLAGDNAAEGMAIFRLRHRGRAVEASLCEVLVPGGGQAAMDSLATRVARVCRADYVLCLSGTGSPRGGFVPVPRQGPVLACRGLKSSAVPARNDWQLVLGDVELL